MSASKNLPPAPPPPPPGPSAHLPPGASAFAPIFGASANAVAGVHFQFAASGNILNNLNLNLNDILHSRGICLPIQTHSGFHGVFQGSAWQKFLQSTGAIHLHGSKAAFTHVGSQNLWVDGNHMTVTGSSHIAYMHGNSNTVQLNGENQVVFVDGNHNAVCSADGDLAIMHGNSNQMTLGNGQHDILVSGNHNCIVAGGSQTFVAMHGNSDNITVGSHAAFVVSGNQNHLSAGKDSQVFLQGNQDNVEFRGSNWALTVAHGSKNVVQIDKGASHGAIAVLGSHGAFATGSHAFSGSHGVSIHLNGFGACANVQLQQLCGGEELVVQTAPTARGRTSRCSKVSRGCASAS